MILMQMTIPELTLGAMAGVLRQVQNIENGRQQRYQYGPRKGGWGEHTIGAIGEMVVAKWARKYWSGSVGDLLAADVGSFIQVRTTEYENGHLTVHHKDADDQPFVSVTGTGPLFCIQGWLFGHEAKQKHWWTELQKGRPAFNVPPNMLHDMATLVLDKK